MDSNAMRKAGQPSAPNPFESNVREIARAVEQNREVHPSNKEASSSEQDSVDLEKIKEEIKNIFERTSTAPSSEQNLVSPDSGVSSDGDYLDGVDEEYRDQVAGYLGRVVNEGIPSVLATVQRENNPYLTDSFHDALVLLIRQKMQDSKLL